MDIRFLGAVEGVTGSCHLIRFKEKLIMLDCGMFQGKDQDLNHEPLPVNPADVDYLFLSHSHIDHSGRIPLLVKNGFKGTIYCTKPTYELCEVMLLDSAHIQEVETEWKNRKAQRSGKPLVEPLYTIEDAEDSFKFFKPVLYDQIVQVDEGLTIRFRDAGHLLGSAIIEMWFREDDEFIKVVYSGDLGLAGKPLLKDPTVIESADYVIIEATYGNRVHKDIEKREEELIRIILKTVERGGTVIIPSFAVGRTQEIIYELNKYYDTHAKDASPEIQKLKEIPVYIDSPLAIKATEVFHRNSHAFDDEAKYYLISGDNPLAFQNLYFTQSVEESTALNFSDEPKIIISASGMCDAGRIKHHLKHNLWKKNCSVIFVGYQAEGTLGRRILDGVKDVKILGEQIHINAEIYNIEGFSGHADKNGLLEWLGKFKKKPKKVFIVHGEAQSKEDFAKEVEENLGLECIIPTYNTIYEIKAKAPLHEIPVQGETPLGKPMMELDPVQLQKLKKELQEDLNSLRELFYNAVSLTEKSLETDSTIMFEKYREINNRILELENELMNLAALSGK